MRFLLGILMFCLSVIGTPNGQLEFWQSSIVYQIYPRSLMDASGDGVGDLRGIISKVSYFKEIGVETIWLSPIFTSPMVDFGYDISNFTEIDPIFGDMSDFDELLTVYHNEDIKVVLDFVPNHSSNESEWFIKSEQNDSKYKDYYIWADAKGFETNGDPIPPNNWVSVFRYSAWEWSESRQQFYYHAFLKEQPDLNYRNPAVVAEMQNVLRFWLDKGVDGFRMDAVHFLFEVEDIANGDEPIDQNSGIEDPTQYAYLNHTNTTNLDQTYEVVRGWKGLLDEYPGEKVMMVEDYNDDISYTMRYYGTDTEPLADFPFNFYILEGLKARTDVTGIKLKAFVDQWMDNMPAGKWPNWVLGNHDNGRISSRISQSVVDSLNMYTLLLPGTPVTYYGEEIGMENTPISYEEGVDPQGCNQGPEGFSESTRDPERTPMQWDDTAFAGFTTGNSTWLPVNENYISLNVASQNSAPQSHLRVYKALASLRKQETFQRGTLQFVLVDDRTFSFVRVATDLPRYLIVINCAEFANTVDLSQGSYVLPATGLVAIRSSSDSRPETAPGTQVDLTAVSLIEGEGLVIELPDA